MSAWQEVKHPEYLTYEAVFNNLTYRIFTNRKGGWFASKFVDGEFIPKVGQIIYPDGGAARQAVENGAFDEELQKLLKFPYPASEKDSFSDSS